ncbi:DUF3488 and transglutaminase-like domain-containing protein [Shewanella sp. A25]|nr:DUF3488 and transglutaminase-like domain-containing protein [Shewanella shenzhenensis]
MTKVKSSSLSLGLNSPQTGDNISRQTLMWLLFTNVAVLSPLFDKTTPWTLGICAICLVWRIGIYLGKVAKPPRLLVTSLAIGAAITLALVSSEIGLLNALINLLILGYALKYIEMRSLRDVRAVVIVGYFLIALTFIDHQSMLSTLHLMVVTLINTCVLVTLYQSRHRWQHATLIGAKLLLQSVPLALLLFIVLPRFAPLWLVPNMKETKTGLSDTIAIGDIGKLTRSTELAFRVSFDREMPSHPERYWRSIVLEDYDGKTWSQEAGIKKRQREAFIFPPTRPEPSKLLPRSASSGSNNQTDTEPKVYRYEVIAEPSHQPWLYGLDVAYSQDPNVVNLPDYRLYALRNVDQRMSYRATSWPTATMDLKLTEIQRQQNLKLPPNSNPRTLALGLEFSRQYPEPQQRLAAMMRYFNHEPYFYTLTPPPLGPQQIDDFLFENKAGFCVHYASAFIFMARASGLPARMVTGYQGGELNSQANYLSIYQYMAHAWAEVWIENRGWVRYDPTAMIAPNRINEGFDAEFSPEQSYLQDRPFSTLRLKSIPWLNELRYRFASLDYYWSQWVLGFDHQRQNTLLSGILGEVTKTKVAVFMSICISLIGLYIAYSVGLFKRGKKAEPLSARYQKICQQLPRYGINRREHLGPSQFAEQLQRDYHATSPQFCRLFSAFSQSYVALKYQNLNERDYRQQLSTFNNAAKALNWMLFRQRKKLK